MGRISKKQAKDKIDELLEIEEFKEEKLSNKKVRLIYEGTKKDKDMADNGFSKKQLEQLSQLMDMKINPINNRLDKIESRLDVLEKKVDNLETKVDNLETKVDNLEIKVDNLEIKVDKIEKRIENLESTPTMSKELKVARE